MYGYASYLFFISGIFTQSTGNLSDKYYLPITPAGWTFSIWGFIYTWQALWIIYACVNIFRKTDQGPAYNNPVLLTAPYLIIYMIATALTAGWLIAFDREQLELAFTILVLTSGSLITCLALAYRSLDTGKHMLIKQGRNVDIGLMQGLVHNGLGIYGTWCTIATMLNFNMLLMYRSANDIGLETSSTITLGVLTALIAVFAFTDLVLLDRYSRYTFTPYIVLMVAFAGSVSKNYVAGMTNSTFTLVLLIIAVLMAIVKVAVTIVRHLKSNGNNANITV